MSGQFALGLDRGLLFAIDVVVALVVDVESARKPDIDVDNEYGYDEDAEAIPS